MKSALLTKAALCICPPAVVAGTVAAVPPVRHAVHRLTAAHEPHARQRPALPPCTPVQHKTLASQLPTSSGGLPVDLNDDATAMSAVAPGTGDSGGSNALGPQLLNPGGSLLSLGPGLLPGGGAGTDGSNGGNGSGNGDSGTGGSDNPAPAVPEPGVWVSMVLGFGLVGAGYRQRRRAMVRSRRLALAQGFDAGQSPLIDRFGPGLGGALAAAAAFVPVGVAPAQAGTKLAQIGSKALHSSMLAKAALCVCPPVAMAVGTAALPPVRHAVYSATAPSVPTAPRTAAATTAGAPCLPVDVPTAAQAVQQSGDKLAVLPPTAGWPG